MMKWSFFIALIIMLLPVNSWASFDSAMASYERKDYYSASNEFKKLAAESDSDAQYMLGYMYALGKGVLQDYSEAHKWFNLAASHGNSDALKARTEVERKMTREEIALAQKKARSWTPGLYKTPSLTRNELEQKQQNRSNQTVLQSVVKTELKDKKSIRQVQKKLSQLGYRPGTADGAIGNNTRKAIRQYQGDNNLPVNGKLTQSLFESLFPEGAPDTGRQKTKTQGLLFPEIWSQTRRSDNTSNKKLLEQLNLLLEKGRQRRAAQSWFLNDMADLIGQNQSTWSTVLLHDTFHDGDFTSSPKWSVISGAFKVDNYGLHSQMTAPAQEVGRQKPGQGLSGAILGAILEHAIQDKKQNETMLSGKPGHAKIVTKQMIPASFALKSKLTIQSRNGRIELGPYLDSQQQQGYQLLFLTEQNQIELLRMNSRSSAVIESKQKNLSLNQAHTIEWLRDDAGKMTIAIDGEQLFQVTDRRYMDNFSGFMLHNFSSSMTLHEITILGKKH